MTARLLPGLLLILAGLTFSGCGNECQRLCKEMADYWTECGMTFGDAEVADCRKAFGGGNGAADDPTDLGKHRSACRSLLAPEENEDGDREIALRARFTCEDMEQGPGGAFGNAGAN